MRTKTIYKSNAIQNIHIAMFYDLKVALIFYNAKKLDCLNIYCFTIGIFGIANNVCHICNHLFWLDQRHWLVKMHLSLNCRLHYCWQAPFLLHQNVNATIIFLYPCRHNFWISYILDIFVSLIIIACA